MKVEMKHLKLRGGVWYTWFKHPLIRDDDNHAKLHTVCTGIKSGDTALALAYSNAIDKFKNDKTWHTPAKYSEARKLHEKAAEAFYTPILPVDNSWHLATGAYVNWPVELDGVVQDQLLAVEDAVKRCVLIEGENGRLTQRVAELENENKALRAALGQQEKELEAIPFEQVANEYITWGAAKGGRNNMPWSHDHLRKRKEHLLEFWLYMFDTLAQIKLAAVDGILAELAEGRTGKTVNNYAEALRGLITFAIDREYLRADPLSRLDPLNDDPERTRRAMTPEEITLLLTKCKPERRIVYEVALCSGLRANELRSVVVGDLDAENCGLKLHAAWTKNRKDGFQVLPQWLVDKLRLMTNGQAAKAPLLPAMPTDTSDTFEADRLAAGIRKDDGNGKDVVDFHALRVTAVTLVDSQDASLKNLQEFARHAAGSSLTLGRYAKSKNSELKKIAEGVGSVVRAG